MFNVRPMLEHPDEPESDTNPRLLTRSPFNARDEISSRDEYKASILEHGMAWDGRSKMVTAKLPVPEEEIATVSAFLLEHRRQVLAACHCAEVIYELHGSHPGDIQVRVVFHTVIRTHKKTTQSTIQPSMFKLSAEVKQNQHNKANSRTNTTKSKAEPSRDKAYQVQQAIAGAQHVVDMKASVPEDSIMLRVVVV